MITAGLRLAAAGLVFAVLCLGAIIVLGWRLLHKLRRSASKETRQAVEPIRSAGADAGPAPQMRDAARLRAAQARMRHRIAANVEQMRRIEDSMRTSAQIVEAARALLVRGMECRPPGPDLGAAVAHRAAEDEEAVAATHGARVLRFDSFRKARKLEAATGARTVDSA